MVKMKAKILVPALLIVLSVMMVTSGAVIAGLTQSDLPTGPVPGKYIIVLKDGVNPAAAAKNLGIKHGLRIGHVYSHAIKGCAASIPEWKLEAIERHPSVKYVEQDIYVRALEQIVPWGISKIGADVVHSDDNKGEGVKVCIIDTGIDYDHPDLVANYVDGIDLVNGDADPLDDNGHGTHCAGIVAAADNDIGVIGVAPEANLYAVKVLNKRGSGFLSTVIAGINWSIENDMHVISMSLGTSVYSESLENACVAADIEGIVIVAAAGNEGDGDPDTIEYSYPAAYDSVIAVGATDINNAAPSWSNSGSFLELAAPGVSIYSTLPIYRVSLTPLYGFDYGTLSGTSMACPHVAGTAALVLASNPSLTNEDVRLLLQSTADDLGPIGWDTVYGDGLVDAEEAALGEDTTDTIPPALVTGVIVTTESSSRLDISWEAVVSDVYGAPELIDHYNVYRSTTTGGTYVHVASPTTNFYSDTVLTASTTYHYVVTAVDTAGNEGEASEEASGTTSDEAPADNFMHVADIAMDLKTAGINTSALATVTIYDASNNLVEGATVSGQWSDATSGPDSGVTVDGQVILESDKVKRAVSETTFTFTVTGVSLTDWAYDSTANDETSDSIIVQ